MAARPVADLEAFARDFVDEVSEHVPSSKDEVQKIKARLARSHHLDGLPSDALLLARLPNGMRLGLEGLLRVKPARTASGVAVVTVMTRPEACPHGVCVFCPGGPRFGTPQAYTGAEPAARRGAELHYDAREQTLARIRALQAIGHRTDKVDLIVIGGTFTSHEASYRESFVKGCLDAMNGFMASSLAKAQAGNETAPSRCVGLTIETKPDAFLGPDVEHTLALGTTRVELGLQSTHDDVLLRVHRGHTDAQSRVAIKRAKDVGLKVGVHMMPGLPGADVDRDLESFRALFEDPAYRPDFLKIYPTLVLPGTALHAMWSSGRYVPLTTEAAVDLVARVKAIVPRWCRIQRVQREIGAPEIRDGPKRGDLRVLARDRLEAWGLACRCIRCREVGLRAVEPDVEDLRLVREEYESSGGLELFLSIEDSDREILVAYGRLRIDDFGATVRELKVFGRLVPFEGAPHDGWQHRGFGGRLMSECERVAREEFAARRVRVTAGVGVRGYFRRLGYDLEGCHMVRRL